MKKFSLLVSISLVLICAGPAVLRVVSQSSVPRSSLTLYSDIKYRGEHRRGCFSLRTGDAFSIWSARARETCDLYYGMLQVGDEKDWVQSASGDGQRSVISDLGLLDWTASFKIPIVAPLPKLKPGEQRQVTIEANGADGADGTPGTPGTPAADADGVVRERPRPEVPPAARVAIPARPKHDGKPKIDPLYVKAIVGHLYVIHVVDEVADFYALFRIDALERGDNCTISWQMIPSPEKQTTVRK